jgi:hypothetical protein
MRGMPCPACFSQVATFGRFLCEVDVNSVLRCATCGARLRRSRASLANLAVLGFLFGIAAYWVIRFALSDPLGTGFVALAVFFVLGPPAFLVAVKFTGWKLVPWVQLEDSTTLEGVVGSAGDAGG